MNRNDLLADIVASAEEEVLGLDKQAMTTENPEASRKAPTEQPTSVIQRLKEKSFHNQATYTEDISEVNHPADRPNSVPDLAYPRLSVDKETHITKLAHSSEGILSLLRETSDELDKEASVSEDNVMFYLEKTAQETLNELDDLEKTANDFGTMVARAFLSEIGRY